MVAVLVHLSICSVRCVFFGKNILHGKYFGERSVFGLIYIEVGDISYMVIPTNCGIKGIYEDEVLVRILILRVDSNCKTGLIEASNMKYIDIGI